MLEENFARLQQAQALRGDGALVEAKDVLEALVADSPDYYAALHILGLTYSDLGDLNSALSYFARAAAVLPDSYISHAALATIYVELSHLEAAEKSVHEALNLKPDAVESYVTLAQIYRDQKNYEAAYHTLRKCLELESDFEEATILLGAVCLDMGLEDEMKALLLPLTRALELRPEVIYLLSTVNSRLPGVDFSELLQRLPLTEREKPDWFYARAGVLQRQQRYSEAWDLYLTANSMVRKGTVENENRNRNWQNESLAMLQRSAPLANALTANDAPSSIFFLGPSRSGKTTAEKTLKPVQAITLGYEGQVPIRALTNTLLRRGLAPAFQYALLPPALQNECRAEYQRVFEASFCNTKIATFTTPSRIHDAYHIAKTIPNCYFVFVRRDPFDTAIRIFQKHYSSGNYYSYDWNSCLEHVIWYNRMIDRLLELLPAQSFEIKYEDLNRDHNIILRGLKRWLPEIIEDSVEIKGLSFDTSPKDLFSEYIGDQRLSPQSKK